MFKPPSNPKIQELLKCCRERRLNTSELPREKKKCIWCMAELTGKKYMWCSSECATSAWAHINPQKEGGLNLLLVKQGWKCAGCEFDYQPIVRKIARPSELRKLNAEHQFHLMKRLKRNTPKERRPEVDHIVPIYKDGQSLGFTNHQVLCMLCHKAKSKVDNSGPRKKNKCPNGTSGAG